MDGVGAERLDGRRKPRRRRRMAERKEREEESQGREGGKAPGSDYCKGGEEMRKAERGGCDKEGRGEREDRGAQKRTGRGRQGGRRVREKADQEGCKGT